MDDFPRHKENSTFDGLEFFENKNEHLNGAIDRLAAEFNVHPYLCESLRLKHAELFVSGLPSFDQIIRDQNVFLKRSEK